MGKRGRGRRTIRLLTNAQCPLLVLVCVGCNATAATRRLLWLLVFFWRLLLVGGFPLYLHCWLLGEKLQFWCLISEDSQLFPNPEGVVNILNLYLGAMTDVINHYQGTINELMGDGIFVIFTASISHQDDSK